MDRFAEQGEAREHCRSAFESPYARNGVVLREMENRRPPLRTYPLEAATSPGGGVVARGELLEVGVEGVVARVGAGVDVVALGAGARLHIVACVECAALERALVGTELVGGLLAL